MSGIILEAKEYFKGLSKENKDIMPRIAFRYALEKFDEETRINLMKG